MRGWTRAAAACVGMFCCGLATAQEAESASSQSEQSAEQANGSEGDSEVAPAEKAKQISDAPLPETLSVVVAGSPPFVETLAGDKIGGPSVTVWERAAQRMGVSYELHRAKNVDAAIEEVATGKSQVAIGPISVTADRARKVSFSQPYLQSALAIAAPEKQVFLERIKPFLSWAFVTAIGALLFILAIVGALMWWAERKKNSEHFPQKLIPGIGNGIWFALVTMTTVGYGDRAPATVLGRIVAGGWMLVSLVTVSSLTAGIATALTLSQIGNTVIESAGQLEGRQVATVPGTLAEEFVRNHGGELVAATTVREAVKSVADGRAEAVVFDRPALLTAMAHYPKAELKISPRRYLEQGYGFAMAHQSPLEPRLNVALLEDAVRNEKLFSQDETDE